ncbi:hypothetical protein DICPUDRAFT_30175 [Dictyostelium purpureum]|uniref:Methyltransferase domain-containing protein n=1 Tax=Dictyostelium purpureum TaxID=5786 RepID=F0ZEZ8_DICPU|nr:uncharacterized protein DICPUDRAFT_30175 [Dictyostelium purpureum]EGC37521.1 hypothetical protein DICPUDRAFT_30175 [Dictyostelium purpureum]|eukprot:XP_003285995.1 hypothetical protein DICPUDRAFT_30175 [Dictyostelium purpureum]
MKKKQLKELIQDTLSPASYEFWDDFYEDGLGKGEQYEWYIHYNQLKNHLLELVKDKDRLLHIGCGNSFLAEDLIEDTESIHIEILNIDVCDNAIERMVERNQKITNQRVKNSLIYKVADATQMVDIKDGHFNGVIDKGTADALLSTLELETGENEMVKLLLREMYRVLNKENGWFICVSRNTCLEPYFYQDDQAEWDLKKIDLTTNSSKGKGIQQVNYIYLAKPLQLSND